MVRIKQNDSRKTQSTTAEENANSSKRGRQSMVRPFPAYTLEKALSIALAIKEKNAGNPWPADQVAKAVGIGQKSSALDIITRSSQLYGLTSGSRHATAISLEKIGREIVYAPSAEAEIIARRRAFLNVEIFAKVLEYYKGCNLPDLEFLSNTLYAEFALARQLHKEFRDVFLENCQFADIGADWRGIESPSVLDKRKDRIISAPAIKSFAASENREGKRCFVIMPFSERQQNRSSGFFGEVFESLIKPAAEAAGFDVLTANKDGSDVIQSTIINEIMDADLVVADLTDHNPNVLFELGLRMSQEKPVAILKTADTGRIFDVDNMLRVFEYNENMWPSTIKTDVPGLEGHIRATWEGKDKNRSYIAILRAKS